MRQCPVEQQTLARFLFIAIHRPFFDRRGSQIELVFYVRTIEKVLFKIPYSYAIFKYDFTYTTPEEMYLAEIIKTSRWIYS